jgi:hypothetical protein
MMIEGSGSRAGSGSGSIPLTSGSGSWRPKNLWIRWIRIRIRIRNTAKKYWIRITAVQGQIYRRAKKKKAGIISNCHIFRCCPLTQRLARNYTLYTVECKERPSSCGGHFPHFPCSAADSTWNTEILICSAVCRELEQAARKSENSWEWGAFQGKTHRKIRVVIWF